MQTDTCIIGGGIMGLATAYNIRKNSDSQVLVLDRYEIGNEFCGSNDTNRVFRYSYGNDELYTKMAVESLQLWRELEKASHENLLLQTGLLLLKGKDEDANGFNEASFRTLQRMGLGAERLDKSDLSTRFPQFRAEEALLDPHGGLLLASKALHTLHRLAETRGVRFRRGHAQKIVSDGRPRLRIEGGETIEFEKLVVTVGPWTRSLLAQDVVPISPTRQQLIYFRPVKGIDGFRPAKCPVFFTDKHYGLPAGGIDAVKVSPKELNEIVDPEAVKWSVDDEQIVGCREACREFAPDIADGEVVRTKVCMYDMTENSDFVLDRHPNNSNIVLGYGFSGHGFKFAPLIGKLLAGLVLESEPNFSLDRFAATPSQRRRHAMAGHLGKGE